MSVPGAGVPVNVATQGLERFFRPQAIAIIGASTHEETIGGRPLRFLLKHAYRGAIYPVNPKYETVLGYRCYPDIAAVPGPVDVAMIAVSAAYVPDIVEACAEHGVAYAIVFSAGFAEIGEGGEQVQSRLRDIVGRTGIRLVGPNCIGSINVAERIPMGFAFPFGLDSFKAGPIGYASQSGAFTYASFTVAQELGLGFHHIANTGNEADLSCLDFLEHMVEDPEVTTLATYIEGVRDGRQFLRLARRAAERRKPVVVLKAGRSQLGRAAIASHTAALSGAEKAFGAAARQAGLVQVQDLDEMMDALMVLSRRKLPKGRRLAVLTTSGASGILMADQCSDHGLEIPPLGDATRQRLRAILPTFATALNPIDTTAMIMDDPNLLKASLDVLINDPSVDMIVAMFSTLTGEVARRCCADVVEMAQRSDKPIAVNFLGGNALIEAGLELLRDSDVPVFRTPGRCARALEALANYAEFLERFDHDRPHWARQLKAPSYGFFQGDLEVQLDALEQDGPTEGSGKDLMRACSISVPAGGTVASLGEALSLAQKVGYPVAVKAESPDILHKTEVGVVRLGVAGPAELERAYNEVNAKALSCCPGARLRGVRVERMVAPGVEVICGASFDPVFGPMVLFGTGGVMVELFKDVSSRMAPVTPHEAREMIDEVRGGALLKGFRGRPPADIGALVDIIVRLSWLIHNAGGRIAEIDLNPVIVLPEGEGAVCADALVIARRTA